MLYEIKKALILGATGAVGQAVTQQLSQCATTITATYHNNTELAQSLESTHNMTMIRCDLRDRHAINVLIDSLIDDPPEIIVHCAAIAPTSADFGTFDAFGEAMQVNCGAVLQIIGGLREAITARGGAEVIMLSALDRAQSLPLPIEFAASQGAINTAAMALAHELAPHNWRINVIACGLLDAGLSSSLDPALHEAYIKYSALKRPGTPDEIASMVTWLAYKNSYMNGKVVSLTGGI